MFAIISHKTKQYKVEVGQILRIDLDEEAKDKKIKFDQILLFSDDKTTKVGQPNVDGASVEGEILGEVKADKVKIAKFHAKKHYDRNNGHRQKYIEVKISSIKA